MRNISATFHAEAEFDEEMQDLDQMVESFKICASMKRQCFDKLQFLKQFYNTYCKHILKQFLLAIDLHYQWEKWFSVCICCRVISVCHIESAFAGC